MINTMFIESVLHLENPLDLVYSNLRSEDISQRNLSPKGITTCIAMGEPIGDCDDCA